MRQSLYRLENLSGRVFAGRIRNRVAGLLYANPSGRNGMLVAGGHDAGKVHVRPGGIDSRRHRRCRFAGADAPAFWHWRKVAAYGRCGVGTVDGRIEDLAKVMQLLSPGQWIGLPRSVGGADIVRIPTSMGGSIAMPI